MKIKNLFIGLFLLLGLVLGIFSQLPNNKLHLVFCAVGQGDATLISYKNTQVLIDGGPNDKVLDCLSRNMPFYDRDIEMVVLTHPQADHFTGLISVIERYNISQFVINSLVEDSLGFWRFREAVLVEGAPVYSPKAGDKINLEPIYLTVLWPEQKLGDEIVWSASGGNQEKILGAASFAGDLNDTSITLKLSFGNFDALFPGDLSSKTENSLTLVEVEVLKVAHHGSKYSTGEDFLRKTMPKLAVISVGKNSFGHPARELLARLGDYDIRILRTDEKGEIEIVGDRSRWYTK